MRRLITLWQATHEKLWRRNGTTPRVAMILTNGGSDKVPAGTPVFVGAATGGVVTVVIQGVTFVVNYTEQRFDGVFFEPMTKEQVGYWNVDFGVQFES